MKQPREVPPATFSALGLVCSSKTMAGRESRKYSTIESSLYVSSVRKVFLDHPLSSYTNPEAERSSHRAAFKL